MSDFDLSTTSALSNDREIFSCLRILPVHIHVERVSDSLFKSRLILFSLTVSKSRVPAVAAVMTCVHLNVVSSKISSVLCLDLFLALLWHTAVLPSRCSQDDLLGLFGFDGELVIGASAFAGIYLSSFSVCIIKDEEVRPAHVVSVEV